MTAWTGIIVGGTIGGILGFTLTKAMYKHADIGVTGGAIAAGALIGGALTAAKPAEDTSQQASQPPTNAS